jgi:hypothetical protein
MDAVNSFVYTSESHINRQLSNALRSGPQAAAFGSISIFSRAWPAPTRSYDIAIHQLLLEELCMPAITVF